MPIYEVLADELRKIEETSFCAAGIQERADLQRLLRANVDVISPDTLVIAEEFGEWEDSRRRIDLLGIDKAANLVVIELKRTEDGGHMDLQAIRYAAMVSAMTFERAVDVYSEYLSGIGSDIDPRSSILDFLDEPDEDSFGQNVRILLVSADFSKELTTSVIWLNEQGLDIRCIRIKPYVYGEKILTDVQQVIPLPEAEEYLVQFKEKQREAAARKFNPDFTKYDITINGQTSKRLPKRTAIFTVVKFLCDSGISPNTIATLIPSRINSMFRDVEGTLDTEAFVQRMRQEEKSGGKRFVERRFYCTDEELIHADGRTFAFTNQWGNRTIAAINTLIQAFPDHKITCIKSEVES
ncbi:MAG: hypothetical protein GX594_12440 [Pirellulaceae bacterium]|nr:hypothetical protein [Pirellulaceae bacterium]